MTDNIDSREFTSQPSPDRKQSLRRNAIYAAIGLKNQRKYIKELTQARDTALLRVEIVEQLSKIDELTDVYNRKGLVEELEQTIQYGRERNLPVSFLYGDLNKFKPVNDEFGHKTGDYILKYVAEYLRNNIRETDYVARLGGDEFGVVFVGAEEVDGEAIFQRLNAEMGTYLRTRIAETEALEDQHIDATKINVSMSGGLTQIRQEDTIDSVLQRADEKLTRIKQARPKDQQR